MKRNELAEIKKMEIKSVTEKVKKMEMEIVNLIMDKNTGKLTNLKAIKNKRRDLAQMLTVMKQKELIAKLEEPNV